jgi:hypothetical protein
MTDGRWLDQDESESIALVSIARAIATFDPTKSTLESWIKLCIHNDIANERRLHERRMVSWTSLGMQTWDAHDEKFVDVGPEAITVDCGTAHKYNGRHVHAGLPFFLGSYAYRSELINKIEAWIESAEAQETISEFLAVSVSESGPRNNEKRERAFLDALALPWLENCFDACGLTNKIKQRQAKRKFLRLVSEGELILPSSPCTDRRCHCGYCEPDPATRAAMLRDRIFYELQHDDGVFTDLPFLDVREAS